MRTLSLLTILFALGSAADGIADDVKAGSLLLRCDAVGSVPNIQIGDRATDAWKKRGTGKYRLDLKWERAGEPFVFNYNEGLVVVEIDLYRTLQYRVGTGRLRSAYFSTFSGAQMPLELDGRVLEVQGSRVIQAEQGLVIGDEIFEKTLVGKLAGTAALLEDDGAGYPWEPAHRRFRAIFDVSLSDTPGNKVDCFFSIHRMPN